MNGQVQSCKKQHLSGLSRDAKNKGFAHGVYMILWVMTLFPLMCLELVRRPVTGFQMQAEEQLDFHSLGEDRRRATLGQQVVQGSKVGCRDASELGSGAFVSCPIFLFLDPGTILASLQKALRCLLIASFRYILHHLNC